MLVTGTSLFAACSLAGGLAVNAGMLVGARLAQGAGAALMAPAGLSILTTTFRSGGDRNRALGVWGAISGLASAAGVFLGGVLSQGPGWRWVLFVNLPVCALILVGAFRLLPRGRPAAQAASLDLPGALLGTGGMLLLIYALVRAPEQGWGRARTIGELATADVTQMIAFAAFVSVFYFLTLYMQNVVGYSPIQSGSAYLPVTVGIAVAAGISAKLFARTGTRPVIVTGLLIAAAGIFWLSRIPVHGTYPANLLPGLVVMAVGLGAVLVAVTTAANADVAPDQAGLAAGLLSASQQLGTALGLAIFSAIATAHTSALLAAHAPRDQALTGGFQRALLACAAFLLAAALVALRASNTRGEPDAVPSGAYDTRDRVPAAEPAD